MITKTALAFAALLLLGIAAIAPAAYAGGTISACGATANSAGTWTVTTNLTTSSSTPCITITASGVAIDLHGQTIKGTGSASTSGRGIRDSGSLSNVIIANGTIQGFWEGIGLFSTEYATIANINVMKSGLFGIIVFQNYVVVTDSQANDNVNGIIFQGGSGNTVNNTSVNNNEFQGTLFYLGSNNTVSNSQANGNGSFGMYFYGSNNNNNTVSNSQANGNGSLGFGGMLFDGSANTITDSQANGNGIGDGIFIGGPNNSLTGNTANGNGGVGITVDCPSNLYGNTANGNTGGSIVLTPTSTGCVRLDNKPAP